MGDATTEGQDGSPNPESPRCAAYGGCTEPAWMRGRCPHHFLGVPSNFADEIHDLLVYLLDDFSLGDCAYHIRENEGEGWDGRRVVEFGKVIEKLMAIRSALDNRGRLNVGG